MEKMILRKRITNRELIHFLAVCAIFELIIGGSGQVFNLFGGFSLRMLIYICIICSYISIIRFNKDFDKVDIILIGGYTLIFCISISFALINNADSHLIFEDIKPLSYFFTFPFFLIVINNQKIITKIIAIVKWGSLLMSIAYIIYLILIKLLGLIDFMNFYASMEQESDFMFRGGEGELFYKGFIFLPIGFIFWVKDKNFIPVLIILIAIYYTMTRGFYVITFLGIAIYYSNVIKDIRIKLILYLVLILSVIIAISSGIFDMGEDRAYGDTMRIVTGEQVLSETTPFSFFIGHGFGDGVPFRPVHMENSFMEIFQKQGLLGILYWTAFVLSIILKARQNKYNDISIPFAIGAVMVFVQSNFNPYISNPIGMGYLLVAYCVCKYYSKHYEKKQSTQHFNMHCSLQ